MYFFMRHAHHSHINLLDSVRKLFTKVLYSDKGSNVREKEERAFMFFTDYLDQCETGMPNGF